MMASREGRRAGAAPSRARRCGQPESSSTTSGGSAAARATAARARGGGDRVALRLKHDAQRTQHRGPVVAHEDPVDAAKASRSCAVAGTGSATTWTSTRCVRAGSCSTVDGRMRPRQPERCRAPSTSLRHVLGLDLAHDSAAASSPRATQERGPERSASTSRRSLSSCPVVVDAPVLGFDDEGQELGALADGQAGAPSRISTPLDSRARRSRRARARASSRLPRLAAPRRPRPGHLVEGDRRRTRGSGEKKP